MEIFWRRMGWPHRLVVIVDSRRTDFIDRFRLFPQSASLFERLIVMDVLYFAWVRERVGLPREVIDANLNTVMDLVELLREREERYVLAFADLSVLRVALDQKLSDFNAPLTDVREVAFFPPMTGG